MSDLNRQQFCAAMQLSESTVRRLELEGMPFTPVGKRSKRYDVAECKRWLRSRGCQFGRTRQDVGTSALWLQGGAYTEYYRKMHLRVMPSGQKLKSVPPLDDAA